MLPYHITLNRVRTNWRFYAPLTVGSAKTYSFIGIGVPGKTWFYGISQLNERYKSKGYTTIFSPHIHRQEKSYGTV